MAFVNRIGNVLKQTISKHVNVESCASNLVLYQAVRSMSTKLFVGGLSYGTDEMSLSQAFSQHGEVVEARIIIDRDNGRSRGFGFVTFASNEEAARAMQALDGQDLHGRRLRVNYATEKPRGPRYDGGYGGGGGGFGYGGGGGGGGGFGYGGSQSGPYGGAGGGAGYDRGNYGSNNNYAGGSNYNYGSGVGGNSASGNNVYSNDGNVGDLGAGGGNDFLGSMSTNQGGFTDSSYDGSTSPNFGNAQEELSGSQFGDVNVDDKEPEMQDGEYKDENDEPNDVVNRSV